MRIIIATDAWEPQINGVARTLKQTFQELTKMGHTVEVIHPGLFTNIPCPFTKDVRLAVHIPTRFISRLLKQPCAVHISTEGPIGFAFRSYCAKNKIPFTTAYHTKFPEYLKKYFGIPLGVSYSFLRWFHRPAKAVMVTTENLKKCLKKREFRPQLKVWSRGVDLAQFYPRDKNISFHEPVGVYVGRISKEKNIEDFLELKGFKKIVVGEGPEETYLREKYPEVIFTGVLHGEDLAQMYSNADVFVFPSTTDTFGLVVIEALACGVPVACYPVDGPGEIIGDITGVGKADWNLQHAAEMAIQTHSKQACLELAQKYSWQTCTEQFFNNLSFDV